MFKQRFQAKHSYRQRILQAGSIVASFVFFFLNSAPAMAIFTPSQRQVMQSGVGYFNTESDIYQSNIPAAVGATACGGLADTTGIDRLLRATADHESGGNPTAFNPGGPAYGKYQMLHNTWLGWAGDYDKLGGTSFATTFNNASDAPESVQDAVMYLHMAKTAIALNGSVFKMAVNHYFPIANEQPARLDQAPNAGTTITPRMYANDTVERYNRQAGQTIQLLYSQEASFNAATSEVSGQLPPFWAVNVPAPEVPTTDPPSGAGSGTANTCSCQKQIMETAMKYAWPEYHPPNFLDMKPEYAAAVAAAQAAGVYVGGGANPGVDCGGFVTLTMRNSGADPNYNAFKGNTDAQKSYMDQHPELYTALGETTNTSQLQPGDIAVNTSHTFIYTGDQAFPGFTAVSASISFSNTSWRTPMASNNSFSNSDGPYFWYRIKCANQ